MSFVKLVPDLLVVVVACAGVVSQATSNQYVRADKTGQGLDKDCSNVTAGEGKFAYTYNKSLACCDADGLTFTNMYETVKSKTGGVATCCIARTKLYKTNYIGSKIACCNNRDVRKGTTCNKIRRIDQIRLTLSPGKNCTIESKPFHVITTRTDGKTSRMGDTCCSSNKLHMISYKKSCCSTAYTPCFTTKSYYGDAVVSPAPPCCGWSEDNDLCREKRQLSLTDDYPPKKTAGGGFRFCADNEAGTWNVTNQPSKLPPLGQPFFLGKQLQCGNCHNKTNRPFLIKNDADDALTLSCCESRTDRFNDKAIRENCCVQGPACHNTKSNPGVPCCFGRCYGRFLEKVTHRYVEGCFVNRKHVGTDEQEIGQPVYTIDKDITKILKPLPCK